ncbi:hypothetical protein [Agromyces aerolatus]|uniref:hypothetical protein n=1 Tax=Agromyces sp. LY-1074 TaxID=3074080 RepID=UPI0028606814|nr:MULTISPECIES: hypothetical protein [unclassified Agromyces]MDR5700173.1 hypothetical protein [Agromyces sp. LY-1074]MDR5706459.1 hypothetical protein [Agromyces sp. LY-1358]
MRLVPFPGNNGNPLMWVNPEHVASVTRIDQQTGEGVQLRAELNVEGMVFQRVDLRDYPTTNAADTAWLAFLNSFTEEH